MLKATFNNRRLLVPVVLLAAVAALLVFTLRASPKSTARSAPPAASADAQHLVSNPPVPGVRLPRRHCVARQRRARRAEVALRRCARGGARAPCAVGVRPSRRGDRRARAAGRRCQRGRRGLCGAGGRSGRRDRDRAHPFRAARSGARGAPLRGDLRRLPRRDRQGGRPRGARVEPEARELPLRRRDGRASPPSRRST